MRTGAAVADLLTDEPKRYISPDEKLTRAEERIEMLEDALRSVDDLLYQFPSSVEFEPDEDNECPDDMTAFVAGLIRRRVLKALGISEGKEPS